MTENDQPEFDHDEEEQKSDDGTDGVDVLLKSRHCRSYPVVERIQRNARTKLFPCAVKGMACVRSGAERASNSVKVRLRREPL
jgi:hypothetical protein